MGILSTSRWVCLLTLAVVTLFPASEAQRFLRPPCCLGGVEAINAEISKCFKQNPRKDCNKHAYMVVTSLGKWRCIKSGSMWLKGLQDMKQIHCVPAVRPWI